MAIDTENCGDGDVMLSYMYDEMASGDRQGFETHLQDCVSCTDEFAALAHGRFSVYEWQKLEFADLPTPDIVIPYSVPAPVRVGVFEGIAVWLAAWRWVFAAALLMVVSLAFAAVRFTGRQNGTPSVAMTDPGSVSTVVAMANADAPQNALALTDKDTSAPAGSLAVQRPTIHRNTPVAARYKTAAGVKKSKLFTDTTIAVHNVQTVGAGKAPVLAGDDYSEDSTLRLADLFEAEVGAK